jgi:dephospho-CoA kinase
LAIEADSELRFQRILQRGRSEDGDREAFETRNERERGWGLDRLIIEADDVIQNDVDLEKFQVRCKAWLEEILAV